MRLELRTPRPGYVTDFRLLPALRDFAVASDASLPRMEFESASIRAIRVASLRLCVFALKNNLISTQRR